jgi:hypothetical protein
MSRSVKQKVVPQEGVRTQAFLDMIAPSIIKFQTERQLFPLRMGLA